MAVTETLPMKEIADVEPMFGFAVPTECPGVPTEILQPRNTWNDKASYDATACKLSSLFRSNFEKHTDGATPQVCDAGPLFA